MASATSTETGVLDPIARGLRIQIVLSVDAPPEVADMMIRIGDAKPALLGTQLLDRPDGRTRA